MSLSAIYITKPWSFILTYNIIYYFLIFVKIPGGGHFAAGVLVAGAVFLWCVQVSWSASQLVDCWWVGLQDGVVNV